MNYGCQSMVGKIESILIKHPEKVFFNQRNLEENYEKFNYIGCPDYAKVLEEYAEFEKILKKEVPEIHYLPEHQGVGLDSIYAHDALKVTKKGAIYFSMGKELRRNEKTATEEYLKSVGIPTLGYIEAPGKMEGGDVVWIDERTVAIGRGYRTNEEGIRQFKNLTKDLIDEYIVVDMPHGEGEDECLHLMSIISMVDVDLAVVYSKYMPVVFREFLKQRGIRLLEVNDEEYAYLGCNVLALAPRVCIVIEGVPEIKRKMEENGCKVYTYPGKEVSYRGTGGPTCLTAPLKRRQI